jgi:signal peptidase I
LEEILENFRSEPIPEQVEKTKAASPLRLILIEILQIVALSGFFFILIDTFIGRVRVENISMLPTLVEGEFLMVDKFAYRTGNFVRGDIIVFHAPSEPGTDYIKRLIGIPGDQITVQGAKVTVNGIILREPYLAEPVTYEGTWTVPPDSLFVLGDNRNQSSDSHEWGFIPYESVVGKALVIYWPFTEFKILSHPNIAAAASN